MWSTSVGPLQNGLDARELRDTAGQVGDDRAVFIQYSCFFAGRERYTHTCRVWEESKEKLNPHPLAHFPSVYSGWDSIRPELGPSSRVHVSCMGGRNPVS